MTCRCERDHTFVHPLHGSTLKNRQQVKVLWFGTTHHGPVELDGLSRLVATAGDNELNWDRQPAGVGRALVVDIKYLTGWVLIVAVGIAGAASRPTGSLQLTHGVCGDAVEVRSSGGLPTSERGTVKSITPSFLSTVEVTAALPG